MKNKHTIKITGNRVYLGNALIKIKNLPNGSIKVIIVDAPFCIGLNTNGKKPESQDRSFAEPFFLELFKECLRVLRADGCLYFKIDWKGVAFFQPLLDRVFQNENFNGVSNNIIWNKGSGSGCKYSYTYENLLFVGSKHFIKGGSPIWNIKGFATGAKKTNGNKFHPTQTPKELIEKILEDSTKEGDLCLDLFSGSCVVAEVAKAMKRHSVGFELSEKYLTNAAQKRNGKINYVEF